MKITEEDLKLNSDEYDTNSNKRIINIIISRINDALLLIPHKITISIWKIMKKINPTIIYVSKYWN